MLFREQLLWSAVDGAQAAESRADIAAHNCSRWKHAASFVSVDELISFRGAFPITAGMVSESLHGYHTSFLGICLEGGHKAEAWQQNSSYTECGGEKKQLQALSICLFPEKTSENENCGFFLITAAHIQEFL